MSEDNSNVIPIFPNVMEPEIFDKETQDKILIANRDEMLEFLEGMRGRVMAFDIRALMVLGFASNPSQDIVFQSAASQVDVARTVGSLEFVKQSIIDDRIRDIEYEEE